MSANATEDLDMSTDFNDALLEEELGEQEARAPEPAKAQSIPGRNFSELMRKIPVTLTLEVGAARISLLDLARLETNSIVELDTLAGEPLTIKVNGATIGRAEVVVSGENYGLKVLELSDLDLDSLGSR